MKKAYMILVILFLMSNIAYSHKEWVHQYLVWEAYQFLEDQLGYEITDFKNHVGINFYGKGDDNYPWETGYIGVAAWREDLEDVVWGYGSFFNGWDPSSTHFWKADDGDDVLTPIPLSGNVENAYYKARIFLFGGHKIFFAGKTLDPEYGWILGRFYSYDSLIDFFNTGHCYFEGYMDLAGYTHPSNPPEEIYMDITAAQRRAYQILGRVSHLLADMSVPAHVHNDEHPCDLGDADYYEMYMGGSPNWECNEPQTTYPAQNWNANTAVIQGGLLPISTDNLSTIRYLFYTLNQLSDHFPSGPGSIDFLGNHDLPNGVEPILTERYQVLGNPPTSIQVQDIANETFNYAIRATATLYYWFALETGLIAKITAKNNFENGIIKVGVDISPTQKNSPYLLGAGNGQTVNLEAHNQLYGGYERLWNTTGVPNSISKWKKQILPNPPINLPNGENISYSFNVSTGDHNSFYIANLKKNYRIDQTHKFEFDPDQTQQTTYIVEQNSGQISAPTTKTVGGKIYNFAAWTDNFSVPNPRTITPTNNVTYTALYKYPTHSDNENAYSNNSQRKFVKTPNGYMYITYESMGYVWLERSTNNGSSWEIMNNGKPIGNAEGISPCIDYDPDYSDVLVSWQKKVGSTYKLKYLVYDCSLNNYRYGDVEWAGGPQQASFHYPHDAQMVVVWNKDNDALFIWKGTEELLYSVCILHALGTTWRVSGSILYNESNYNTPTLYCNKSASGTNNRKYFHLAYQYLNSDIHYRKLTLNVSNPLNPYLRVGAHTIVSSGTGYSQNYNPSIITIGTGARVCWVGQKIVYGYEEDKNVSQENVGMLQYKVVFKDPNNTSRFWQFGNNVSSPNINKNSSNTYYALGWRENSNQIKFADNSLSTVRTITGVTGQELQICNGTDKNNMYCMAYEHNSGAPYYFSTSNSLGSFYPLGKTTNNYFTSGREGIVSIDSAEFYFALGDLQIDGQPVDFVEIADSVSVNNLNTLNQYILTEPISISDNSSFVYSVQYGINDSLSATQAMIDDRFINFKVLLVDNNTGEIIGEHDNVTYNSENIYQYNNISYLVNTQGIGNRSVRLKLVIDNNFASNYSLSKIYADETVLGKTSLKEINFNGIEVIESYDLSQNYPNPFNPSTTIKYQLPDAGNVTLKIYDILGSKVATLVDDFKNEGRYEVNFNASNLASGVYLYRLKVNDFVDVKKMLMLK